MRFIMGVLLYRNFVEHGRRGFQSGELGLPNFKARLMQLGPGRGAGVGDGGDAVVALGGSDERGVHAHIGSDAGEKQMRNILTA